MRALVQEFITLHPIAKQTKNATLTKAQGAHSLIIGTVIPIQQRVTHHVSKFSVKKVAMFVHVMKDLQVLVEPPGSDCTIGQCQRD